MPNKDDLLNLNNKKTVKKPLIYAALAFLVFIIGVLGFAIYNNTSSKQDNVVLPPQIQEVKQDTMFKEVPIEETNTTNDKINLADKLIKNENKNTQTSKNTKEALEKIEKEKVKTEVIKQEPKKEVNTVAQKNKKPLTTAKYYVQVAALMKYKKPNQKFLNLIKKEGYNYKLYETYYVKNGKKIEVIKILIGPFDKTTVNKELKKIKNSITQNAFIYKVK
jgi:DedD protein